MGREKAGIGWVKKRFSANATHIPDTRRRYGAQQQVKYMPGAADNSSKAAWRQGSRAGQQLLLSKVAVNNCCILLLQMLLLLPHGWDVQAEPFTSTAPVQAMLRRALPGYSFGGKAKSCRWPFFSKSATSAVYCGRRVHSMLL